jgi:predicted aspartyl protease
VNVKNKLSALILAVAVSCACKAGEGAAEGIRLSEDSVRQALRSLEHAFRLKDEALLQRCLAENFSVSIANMPAAMRYVAPVLEKNLVEGVDFLAMDTTENDLRLVRLNIRSGGSETETVAAFDRRCKFVFIDYLDRLYGHSRYSVSEQKALIPFELREGHIVIPVRLNGSGAVLRFLFDTGADGMAIRRSLADSLGLAVSHRQNASVVGGSVQVEISSANTVHLTDSFSLKNQSIALFPTIKHGMDGVIGLNLAAGYVVGVDFDKGLLSLSTFGAQGREEKEIAVPALNRYGLLMLQGTLNIVGKKEVAGNFIFDTGAAYHLIAFSRFVRKNRLLLTGFQPEGQASTVSMGHATPVFYGKARSFRLAPQLAFADMPVTLQASTGAGSSERTPDGSVGIKLIRGYNFSIDLLRKELRLYPRRCAAQAGGGASNPQ